MPLDPRRLKPGQLLTLVNSTPLGQVLTEAALRKLRQAAGTAIGDGQTIDFFRFTNWLVHRRHASPAATSGAPGPQPSDCSDDSAERYSRHKARARQRSASQARAGQDIGPIPPVADPARRALCQRDLERFCKLYFPHLFALDWSDDHLRALKRIETAVLDGGCMAFAMPRGSGKTTICEVACIWALVFGHRTFVALIGASAEAALESITAIKTEFECNELLLADFPEVCFPIEQLGGQINKQGGQRCQGERTQIAWLKRKLILPTVRVPAEATGLRPQTTGRASGASSSSLTSHAYSLSSGTILQVAGITGRIRGMKHVTADGRVFRPDLALIDDPQTDSSARSPSQCAKRLKTVAGAILGLPKPGQKMAAFMPCTVIQRGDMADHILDRQKYPDWQGERCKLVYEWPTAKDLWDEYARIRAESLRNSGTIESATEFYRSHRAAMDAGSRVAWPARKEHDELSALQHAMNLRCRMGDAFFAEYQQEPVDEIAELARLLSPDQLAAQVNRLPRGRAPLATHKITGFIDVQGDLLFWLVAAWSRDFSGAVLDYGTWPEQPIRRFSLDNAPARLGRPGQSAEAALSAGLHDLVTRLLARDWPREGGATQRLDRLLIDANFQTRLVKEFIRRSPLAGLLLPSHGRGIRAVDKPFSEQRTKRFDQVGTHWMIPHEPDKHGVQHLLIDTNFWKSFIHNRLAVALGDPSALSFYGSPGEVDHGLLIEHLLAEYPTEVEGRGRKLDEWQLRPGATENHWLDCLVGAACAANTIGIDLPELGLAVEPPRPALNLRELQKARKRKGGMR